MEPFHVDNLVERQAVKNASNDYMRCINTYSQHGHEGCVEKEINRMNIRFCTKSKTSKRGLKAC